jgi:trk system potassium uptake protein TrkA
MAESDHLVIAGGGRIGRRVAADFVNRGSRVTIIERDGSVIDIGSTDGEVTYLEGDATRPSLLREAITDETDVLGALTDDQSTNLAVCMAAKQLYPEIETVARIELENGDEYAEFVDRVYFPERASIKAGINALSGSDIRTLEGVTGDLELFDIRVDYDAPAAGQVVKDVLPEGSVVVSEEGGDVAVQHSTKLVAGRRYIVAADYEVVDEVLRKLRGEDE